MKIVAYDEMVEKGQLFPLQWLALRSSFDYREFEKRRRMDFRLKGGPGGFCALENGKLVGFLVVMDVLTLSVEGQVTVGIVGGVAAHPGVARKGVGTGLMETAHDYFRGMGHNFAFLATSRVWAAYNFYLKLGYRDVEVYKRFAKVFKVVKWLEGTRAQDQDDQSPTDEVVSNFFAKFTANRTGFVLRPTDYLTFQIKHGLVDPALSVRVDGGYALVSGKRGFIEIEELVVRDRKAQDELLGDLEEKARTKGLIGDPLVSSEWLLIGYQARDYMVERTDYGALMAKPLVPGVSVEEAYGDAFYVSWLDLY
jgi:GNAT superfamily N-acetyltransferase